MLLETLISINGTKAAPVKDVTVQGVTFRDAADSNYKHAQAIPHHNVI